MTRIKGTALLGAIKFVKAKGYPGGVDALVARLEPEARGAFDERIQGLGWYPYEAYGGLLEAMDREMGAGDLSLMPEVGRFTADADIRGFLKAMATLFSPQRSLEQAGYFWKKHCDRGAFEATEISPGGGTAELRDFPDVSPAHCHLLTGWLNGIGTALGASNEFVDKTACVHDGDPVCRYVMRWE